ncbi:MFS transporter [Phytohabitans flavus]|uniref:MFS transporter n=1 Tax=Phytohabitans flavus TaxID=1076124 RepID=UPI003641481C
MYLQQGRGDSAVEAGLHLLPMGIAAVLGAVLAARLTHRIGARFVQRAGALASLAGLLLLSRVDSDDSYTSSLLPGFVLLGLGVIGVAVAGQITAQAGAGAGEAGGVSGVLTTGYQVGGALGLALATTLPAEHSGGVSGVVSAAVETFQDGILVAAGFAAVNLVLALLAPATPRSHS